MRRLLALMLGLLLAGAPASAWAATARAELKDAQGKVVGRATLSDASGGSGTRVAYGAIPKERSAAPGRPPPRPAPPPSHPQPPQPASTRARRASRPCPARAGGTRAGRRASPP